MDGNNGNNGNRFFNILFLLYLFLLFLFPSLKYRMGTPGTYIYSRQSPTAARWSRENRPANWRQGFISPGNFSGAGNDGY